MSQMRFYQLILGLMFYGISLTSMAQVSQNSTKVKDEASGLYLDKNLQMIKTHCTACHSAKIITMNRFSREGWKEKIVWMQKTQNLWPLGEAEPQILDYLEKYYAPEKKAARRTNLETKEWYVLEE